jgi:hypothetical protein
MKIVSVSERVTQVKEDNKIMFEVISNRKKTKFNGVKNGLGIVLDCDSIEECIEETISRLNHINEDFKKRIINI